MVKFSPMKLTCNIRDYGSADRALTVLGNSSLNWNMFKLLVSNTCSTTVDFQHHRDESTFTRGTDHHGRILSPSINVGSRAARIRHENGIFDVV